MDSLNIACSHERFEQIDAKINKIKPLETTIEAVLEKLDTFAHNSDIEYVKGKMRNYLKKKDFDVFQEDYHEFKKNSISTEEIELLREDITILKNLRESYITKNEFVGRYTALVEEMQKKLAQRPIRSEL